MKNRKKKLCEVEEQQFNLEQFDIQIKKNKTMCESTKNIVSSGFSEKILEKMKRGRVTCKK